jgi:SAICAR synthetase
MAYVKSDLEGALPLVASGKVRDLYEINSKTLLFVATDRISAYDVIMQTVSPAQQKGDVQLTDAACVGCAEQRLCAQPHHVLLDAISPQGDPKS